MKLIKLRLFQDFRSLKSGFEINFHNASSGEELLEFHPFCLAGVNGSGKSNVLEALANIFYHLECCVNGYPEYAFSPKESSPNAYDLEYYISNISSSINKDDLLYIRISKKKKETPKMSINGEGYKNVTKNFGSTFLPDLVVAYSSGENETLSLPFVKMKLFQYDEYIKDFINKGVYDKPKSSLLYIDYEMSQAVLLTTLLFFDFEKDGKKSVLSPLKDELGIIGIQQFTINLSNNWQKRGIEANGFVAVKTVDDDTYENDEDKKKYVGRVLDHLHDQIEKIEECATCSYRQDDFVSLDFWIDENTKKLVREKFNNNPYDFFNVFQMLQALNERVEEKLEKEEVYNSKGFYTDYKKPEYSWFFNFTNYFVKQIDKSTGAVNDLLLKQLSDGEQQFLHTLGICLMLKNKRTLLLLDEPETHFNPNWRSKFIFILRKTLEAGGDNFLLKDVILTSHSPFIISDCKPSNVILFRLNAVTKKIETISALDRQFNTYGASVDLILQEIFGVENSISQQALNEIKDLLSKDSVDVILKGSKNFGESFEKAFLFEKIAQLKKDQKK